MPSFPGRIAPDHSVSQLVRDQGAGWLHLVKVPFSPAAQLGNVAGEARVGRRVERRVLPEVVPVRVLLPVVVLDVFARLVLVASAVVPGASGTCLPRPARR